jgi:molybdopterin converting factor small subunit
VKVTVACFGALREYLPSDGAGNRADVECGEGATVEKVAASFGIPEGSVFVILVNGEQRAVDHELEDGDEITLMPPFAGGLA